MSLATMARQRSVVTARRRRNYYSRRRPGIGIATLSSAATGHRQLAQVDFVGARQAPRRRAPTPCSGASQRDAVARQQREQRRGRCGLASTARVRCRPARPAGRSTSASPTSGESSIHATAAAAGAATEYGHGRAPAACITGVGAFGVGAQLRHLVAGDQREPCARAFAQAVACGVQRSRSSATSLNSAASSPAAVRRIRSISEIAFLRVHVTERARASTAFAASIVTTPSAFPEITVAGAGTAPATRVQHPRRQAVAQQPPQSASTSNSIDRQQQRGAMRL